MNRLTDYKDWIREMSERVVWSDSMNEVEIGTACEIDGDLTVSSINGIDVTGGFTKLWLHRISTDGGEVEVIMESKTPVTSAVSLINVNATYGVSVRMSSLSCVVGIYAGSSANKIKVVYFSGDGFDYADLTFIADVVEAV